MPETEFATNPILQPRADADAASTPAQRADLLTITNALIAGNVLIFLAMLATGASVLSPTLAQAVHWGADFGPLTAYQHEWWRLVSACFVHFGIIHIGLNMYVLYRIGSALERLYGPARYVLLYFIAGIGGNVLGLYVHPFTVAAGASGAVFGCYGGLLAFLAICPGIIPSENAKYVAKSVGVFLVVNLLYSLRPGIDISAHIGGLVTGFIAGAGFAWSLRSSAQRTIRLTAVVVATCVVLGLLLVPLPRYVLTEAAKYQQSQDNQ